MFSDIAHLASYQVQRRMAHQAKTLAAPRQESNPVNALLAYEMINESISMDAGSKNGQLHIARNQTAKAALNQASSIVDRLSSLSVQATDSSLSDADRNALNTEAQELTTELDDLMNNTSYNGQKVFSGAEQSVHIASDHRYTDVDASSITSTVSDLDLSSSVHAQNAMAKMDAARAALSNAQVRVSSNEMQLSRAVVTAEMKASNLDSAAMALTDANFVEEMSSYVQNLTQTKVMMTVHRAQNLALKQTLELIDD